MRMKIPNKLICLIEEKISQRPFIVAIDGRCASGKTTLAAELKRLYDFNIVHMDDFYLPFNKRTAEIASLPGGHMDYTRLLNEILIPFSSVGNATYIPYDCHNDKFLKPIFLDSSKGLLIEGSYSLYPNLRNYYSIKAFLDISKELQLKRLAARNINMLQNFIDIWIPKEEYYFEKCDVENACDIVISSNELS